MRNQNIICQLKKTSFQNGDLKNLIFIIKLQVNLNNHKNLLKTPQAESIMLIGRQVESGYTMILQKKQCFVPTVMSRIEITLLLITMEIQVKKY